MKKSDMHELAKVGMRERLKAIEADLRDWYREFPDVFLVPPPQLVRPELRDWHPISTGNGNGNGTGHAGSKAAKLVPFLREHGPARAAQIVEALGLRSPGSLSSALKRRIEEGVIQRVDHGLYAAVEHGTKPMTKGAARRLATIAASIKQTGKKKKKPKVDVKAQRARTARVLEIVANADGPIPGNTLAELSGMLPNAFGALIARGYLKNGAKGLTRTAKEFVV